MRIARNHESNEMVPILVATVAESETLAEASSSLCMLRHPDAVMPAYRLAFRARWPGFGSVEECSICKGTVDVSSCHWSYTV